MLAVHLVVRLAVHFKQCKNETCRLVVHLGVHYPTFFYAIDVYKTLFKRLFLSFLILLVGGSLFFQIFIHSPIF